MGTNKVYLKHKPNIKDDDTSDPVSFDEHHPEYFANRIETQTKIANNMKQQKTKMSKVLVIVDDFADCASCSRKNMP